ncbi:hypothetical protein CMK22_13030 [Candidatus Poribacteria bacterium]|nr:hypothetical protein [Candidatus Poribacteria bacterium]
MFWQSVSTKAEANTASSAKLAANNVQEVSSDGSGLTGPLFSELLSSLIAGIEDPEIQAALNSQNQTFDLGASFPGKLQPMINLLNESQQKAGLANQNLFQPSISYHHDDNQLSISVTFPGLDSANVGSANESFVMDQWHFANISLSPELSIDRLSELVSFAQGLTDSSSLLESSSVQGSIRSRVEHLKNALWSQLSAGMGINGASPKLQVAVDDDIVEIGLVGRDFSISLPKTAFLETDFPSESIASVLAIPFLFSLNDTNQLPTDNPSVEADSVSLVGTSIESLNKLIHQNLISAATNKVVPEVELGIKPVGENVVIQVAEHKLSIQLPQSEFKNPDFPLEQLAGTMAPLISRLQDVDLLPLSSDLEGAEQIVAGRDLVSSNSFYQDGTAMLATVNSLGKSDSVLPVQSTDLAEPENTALTSPPTATQMTVDYLSGMTSEKGDVDSNVSNSSQLSLSAKVSDKHIRLEFQADLPRHLESITQKIEQIVSQNQQNNPTSTVEMLQSHAQRLASTTNVAVTGQMDPEFELDLKGQQIESVEVKSAKIDMVSEPIVQKGFAQLRRQGYQLFQRLQGNVELASGNLADGVGSGEIPAQLDVAAEFEGMLQSEIGDRVSSNRSTTFIPISSSVQNLGGADSISQNIEVGTESLAMSPERTIQEARQQMIEEIESYRQLARGNGTREVTIRLRPEHLGRLIVRVINQNEEIAVQIRATTTEAQNLLVSELADLSVTLREQGIQLGNLDISLIGSENDSQQSRDRSAQFSDQQQQSNSNSDNGQNEQKDFESEMSQSEMNQDMSHGGSDDDSNDLNLII